MELSEYLPMFLAEGREHLQELNLAIIRIEEEPDDQATVDEIFRIAHSMKGMSATMGFAGMAALTHAMEDVLELLRQRSGGLEREAVDVLLECLDGGGRMARVLVVDDAAFMRKMVTDALVKGGHEVIGEAGTGTEAVERYVELKPEVTTLDITMPEKDGLTALKEIIAIDPGARVVMCSALGQESKVLESIRCGARDFVVKPFQADRVIEAVGKALA